MFVGAFAFPGAARTEAILIFAVFPKQRFGMGKHTHGATRPCGSDVEEFEVFEDVL